MSHREQLAALPELTKEQTGNVHDRKRRLQRRATKTRLQIFDIQIARRKVRSCFTLVVLGCSWLLLVLLPSRHTQ